MADDIEAELELQLGSQREALAGLDAVLSREDAINEEGHVELLQMQGELRAAVAELESALLEIKRARILEHLTASMSGVGSSGGGAPPPHTILPAATAAAPESCGAVLPPPGSLCHFRYMDGRWYYGLVQGPGRQAGTLAVSFQIPTRPFMLDPVDVMEALVRPCSASTATGSAPSAVAPSSAAAAAAGRGGGGFTLQGGPSTEQLPKQQAAGGGGGESEQGVVVGRRLLAQLPGSRLYVPVEVVALDGARATATVLPLLPHFHHGREGRGGGGSGGGSSGGSGSGGQVVVPLTRVARHAHVPLAEVAGAPAAAEGQDGSGGDGSDSDGGGSSSSISALLRPALGAGGSSSDNDDDEDDDDDGGSGDSDVDLYGSDDGDGDVDDDAEGGRGGVGVGGRGKARGEESDGLDVFGHARLAAAAGALDDSTQLADWEAHGRGVASRLLVRMGYVRGRGLGCRGQGTMAAPEVLLLPERRGLGAADKDRVRRVGGSVSEKLKGGVSKRRKRGGAREKRKKAIVAAREARQEAREQQQGAPGGGGLFDFINSSLGDSSAAARIRKAQVSVAGVAGGGGGAGQKAGAAAIAGAVAAASGGGGGVRGPPDRLGLMSHHDAVAGVQTKLSRLRDMLSRHRDNRGMRIQIESEIRAAQAELATAQSATARASKAIHDKDAQKKWMKF